MEIIKIEINEMDKLLAELVEFKVESPIGYARGKTIVSIERKRKKIVELYEDQKKLTIYQYGIPDEKDPTGYKTYDDYIPDPKTGNPVKVNKYDFGDNKVVATKALDDLAKFTFQKNEDDSPIIIDLEVHKVTPELAKEFFEKKKEFSGLAYTFEFLFPK